MEWVRGGLWLSGVFVRWGSMSPDEADEWRRRVLARERFLELSGNNAPQPNSRPDHSGPDSDTATRRPPRTAKIRPFRQNEQHGIDSNGPEIRRLNSVAHYSD
jgi:hypothetical protein